MDRRPIGFFDSGVGGTSIWREIRRQMPSEHTLYLADSKYAPYGEKEPAAIIGRSVQNTEFLLRNHCKLVVVACNTATTNAIDYLRSHYEVPFIGIEPAIKPAALKSKSGIVGVLATQGTLTSKLFHSTSKIHAKGISIIEQVGTGLVELVEQGRSYAPETRALLQQYLDPMVAKGIDHLVLGCTHYPYLIPLLKEILPEKVTIIDSGEAVARQTKAVLTDRQLLNSSRLPGASIFHTNVDPTVLSSFLEDVNDKQVSYLDF